MITMQLHVGAKVYCQDGYCGNLTTVILNDAKGRITDLIVEPALTDASPSLANGGGEQTSKPPQGRKSLLKVSRAVPVALTDYVDDRGVHLRIDIDELVTYPEGAEVLAQAEKVAD